MRCQFQSGRRAPSVPQCTPALKSLKGGGATAPQRQRQRQLPPPPPPLLLLLLLLLLLSQTIGEKVGLQGLLDLRLPLPLRPLAPPPRPQGKGKTRNGWNSSNSNSSSSSSSSSSIKRRGHLTGTMRTLLTCGAQASCYGACALESLRSREQTPRHVERIVVTFDFVAPAERRRASRNTSRDLSLTSC